LRVLLEDPLRFSGHIEHGASSRPFSVLFLSFDLELRFSEAAGDINHIFICYRLDLSQL